MVTLNAEKEINIVYGLNVEIWKQITLAVSFPSSPMTNSSKPKTSGDALPRWKILEDVPRVTLNSIVFAIKTFVIIYTDFFPFRSVIKKVH